MSPYRLIEVWTVEEQCLTPRRGLVGTKHAHPPAACLNDDVPVGATLQGPAGLPRILREV